MSHSVSRRQFLHGLGIVAAAAALSACSSTNQAISEAIIDGTVGGLVTTECGLYVGTLKMHNAEQLIYRFSLEPTLKNVSSKTVTISGDNFAATLDGTPIALSDISAMEGDGDSSYYRSFFGSSFSIKPGEERSFKLSYNISQLVHDNWYKDNHTVAVTFTCGGQRVTYTGTSRSNDVKASEIENI